MRDARYVRLISWTLRCGSEHSQWSKKNISFLYDYRAVTKTMSLQKLSLPSFIHYLSQLLYHCRRAVVSSTWWAPSTLVSSQMSPWEHGLADISCQKWGSGLIVCLRVLAQYGPGGDSRILLRHLYLWDMLIWDILLWNLHLWDILLQSS